MKVLLVGQNPSRYNLDPKVAFKGTKSFDIITGWIDTFGVSGDSYMLINAFTKVNQKYLKKEYVIASERVSRLVKGFEPETIIALGKRASEVLKMSGIDHFELPHPSGRNRKLNNKEWLKQELKKAREYIWRIKCSCERQLNNCHYCNCVYTENPAKALSRSRK